MEQSRRELGEAKRLENAAKALQKRIARNRLREHEKHLIDRYNLRFVHVRADTQFGGRAAHPARLSPKGGVTVAYQLPARKGDSVIRVSVSLVHERDAYNKAMGRVRAASNFANGEHINLRVPRNSSPAQFLKQTFGVML